MTSWADRVTVDPAVCHCQPCFRGTRIPISVILDNVAAGVPIQEILAAYPSLPPADSNAVQAHTPFLRCGAPAPSTRYP